MSAEHMGRLLKRPGQEGERERDSEGEGEMEEEKHQYQRRQRQRGRRTEGGVVVVVSMLSHGRNEGENADDAGQSEDEDQGGEANKGEDGRFPPQAPQLYMTSTD